MNIGIISLFPEIFSVLDYGITGRALQQQLLKLHFYNPRDHSDNAYQSVDDRPYGGGPGMLMCAPPLQKAVQEARSQLPNASIMLVSPKGRPLDQAGVASLKQQSEMIWVAGRYEGIDQRFIDNHVDEQWSIGDYVISGGEFAILVILDALIRLLPGALRHPESAMQDSFVDGLLDCPHYTRPEIFENQRVPEVLLGGNHQAIAEWRLQQALGSTWKQRPDLLKKRILTEKERTLLQDYQASGDK